MRLFSVILKMFFVFNGFLSRRAVFSPSDNRWNAVGGEAHLLLYVEVVDGLDESDASYLEKVVHVLSPARKLLKHGEDEPQIAADERFSRLSVPALCSLEQQPHFFAAQDGQPRRVDAADLHLAVSGHK
jgi:hypothetical protein